MRRAVTVELLVDGDHRWVNVMNKCSLDVFVARMHSSIDADVLRRQVERERSKPGKMIGNVLVELITIDQRRLMNRVQIQSQVAQIDHATDERKYLLRITLCWLERR